MPKCYGCKRPVSSGDLLPFGKNNRGWPEEELGCVHCRRKKLTQVASKEVTMSQKERKPIVSFQVFEEEKTEDGEKNYLIEASAKLGGFTMSFAKTTDEIRTYFTERKMAKEREEAGAEKKRHLQTVE